MRGPSTMIGPSIITALLLSWELHQVRTLFRRVYYCLAVYRSYFHMRWGRLSPKESVDTVSECAGTSFMHLKILALAILHSPGVGIYLVARSNSKVNRIKQKPPSVGIYRNFPVNRYVSNASVALFPGHGTGTYVGKRCPGRPSTRGTQCHRAACI